MIDDGKGPYRYCASGDSHCLDQKCGCVNSCFYQMQYHIARDQPGRALVAWWPWALTIVILAAFAWVAS